VSEPVSKKTPSGRYTLGPEIGRGAQGCVIAARDNLLGRTVAMKRLHVSDTNTRDDVMRFEREARVTGRLAHRNVLYVYEAGTDAAGCPYFTMPYVPGAETLRDVIDHLQEEDPGWEARYSLERRVEIVIQVCEAIHHAHQRGVIHRDVKPSNVLLGRGGEVLLVDWGLARFEDDARSTRPRTKLPTDPEATDPDCLVGTPVYMAPEQILGNAVPQSDVFGLAALLYELICLEHYLGLWQDATSFEALLGMIVANDRQPCPLFVPDALAAICDRGLNKDLLARYSSAESLADALRRWLVRRSRPRALMGLLGAAR
jgi:serine/threonine protein kinase